MIKGSLLEKYGRDEAERLLELVKWKVVHWYKDEPPIDMNDIKWPELRQIQDTLTNEQWHPDIKRVVVSVLKQYIVKKATVSDFMLLMGHYETFKQVDTNG
jgi:hypothetical protein